MPRRRGLCCHSLQQQLPQGFVVGPLGSTTNSSLILTADDIAAADDTDVHVLILLTLLSARCGALPGVPPRGVCNAEATADPVRDPI